MLLAGKDKCLLASTGAALMNMSPVNCANLGGRVVYFDSIIDDDLSQIKLQALGMKIMPPCYLHLCLTTAVNCTPTERYETHQVRLII